MLLQIESMYNAIFNNIIVFLHEKKWKNSIALLLGIVFTALFTLPSISHHLYDCDDILEERFENKEELNESEKDNNFLNEFNNHTSREESYSVSSFSKLENILFGVEHSIISDISQIPFYILFSTLKVYS